MEQLPNLGMESLAYAMHPANLSAHRSLTVYEATHLERRHEGYAEYTTQAYAVRHGNPAPGMGPSSKPCLQGCFFKESLFNTLPDHSLETFSPPFMRLDNVNSC